MKKPSSIIESVLKNVINHAHDILSVIDIDLRITYINNAAERVLGIQPEAIIGESVGIFCSESNVVIHHLLLEAINNQTDSIPTFTSHCRHFSTGEVVILEHSVELYYDDSEFQYGIVTSCDITTARNKEFELNELKNDLVEAQYFSQTGSYSYYFKDNRLEFSAGYLIIHEISEPYITLDEFYRVIHPTDKDRISSISNQLYDFFISGKHTQLDIRYRIIGHESKKTKVLWDVFKPIFKDDELVGVRGTIHDMTEEMNRELQLMELNKDLQESQRLAEVGSWKYDLERSWLELSEGLKRLLEIESFEMPVTPERFIEYVLPEDRDTVSNSIESLLASFATQREDRHESEFRLSRHNGEVKYVSSISIPIYSDGKLVGMKGVIKNITPFKELERIIHEGHVKLKESEARYRIVVENAYVGVGYTSLKGEFYYANPTLAEMFGFRLPVSLIGSNIFDLTSADTKRKLQQRLTRAKEKELSFFDYIGEFYGHSNMNKMFFRVQNTLTEIDNRQCLLSVFIDVTDKVKANLKQVEAEHWLRTVLNIIPHPIFAKDIVGRFVMANEATAQFLGTTVAGLLGKTDAAFCRPEDVDKYLKTDHEALSKWEKVEVEEQESMDSKGNMRYMRTTKIPFRLGVKKDPYVVGIAIDVSEKLATQRALEETNFVFSQAQQFANLGSWRWTIRTGALYLSESAYRILGIPKTSIPPTQKSFLAIVLQDDMIPMKKALTRCLKGNHIYEVQHRIQMKDGVIRWLSQKGNVIRDEQGAPVEMYGITQDITDHKKRENDLIEARRLAEEASIIKEEFVSVMSHEIRTPLNSVIGLSNLLLRKSPREDQLALLTTLKNSSNNLLSLINDVLDFNKIQTGKVELMKSTFNVEELLQQLLASYQPLAYDKGLDFKIAIDPDIPTLLKSDVVRFNQILNNLIINALKFTSRGSVKISAQLTSRKLSQCIITIEIQDTGIGLTNEQLDKLFLPFQQADKNITRRYGGTGLGLSIVKSLVSLLKGKIWVKSIPGKGSSFFIQLPFGIVKKATPSTSRAERKANMKPLHGYQILYVEDVESNQLLVKTVLEDFGASCITAESGRKALQHTLLKTFDIILMDLHMPVMDGYQTTLAIRAQVSGNTHTPVVAFTADSISKQLRRKTMAVGIIDILTKPFAFEELVLIVKKYSSRKAGKQELLSMEFYENIFNHDSIKLMKFLQSLQNDFERFEDKFMRYEKAKNIRGMMGEIQKVLPLATNLKCHSLLNLLRRYNRHKTYSAKIGGLRKPLHENLSLLHKTLKGFKY